MAFKNYLITDFGASNGRVVVARFDGRKFSLEEVHRFDNTPVYAAGSLYWDVLRLYEELKRGIQAAVRTYGKIESMGIDTWGIDFSFIDKNGRLIANPGNYRDEKRWAIANALYERIPLLDLYRATGGITLPVASIYQMFYLKSIDAPELLNAHRFLMMTDLFNYFLTGRALNEFTAAAITLMYDQKGRKWERSILEAIGIPEDIFPEMLMPGSVIGPIQESVCRELGIPPITVVAPCTHDTPGAIAGIPVVNEHRNWAFLPIGTWCIPGMEAKELIIKEEGMAAGYYNEGGAEGQNLFVKNTTGLWLIQQCRKRWMEERKGEIAWDEIVNGARGARRFGSFINVDAAAFAEPKADMAAAIRDNCRGKGLPAPGDEAEVARCVFESLALRFRYDLDMLETLADTRLQALYVVGGGARNGLLCQLTADATGLPVSAGPVESATIGNLLMQLQATGEIRNLEEGRMLSLASTDVAHYEPHDREAWDEQYGRYRAAFVVY